MPNIDGDPQAKRATPAGMDPRDPLIWVSVDSGTRAERPLAQDFMPSPSEATDADGGALDLQASDIIPATGGDMSRRMHAIPAQSVFIKVDLKAGNPFFTIKHCGAACASILGHSWMPDARFCASDDPFFCVLEDHLDQLFDTGESVSFEMMSDDKSDGNSDLRVLLIPLGEDKVEMIHLVVSEATQQLGALGAGVLELQEMDVVESGAVEELQGAEVVGEQDSRIKNNKSATMTREKQMLKVVKSNSVADLISQAQNSAEDAREAELKSRVALHSALGDAYNIALRAERSPEDFALQLVFGSDCDEDLLAEYTAILNQARQNDVDEGGLVKFLNEEAITAATSLQRSNRVA